MSRKPEVKKGRRRGAAARGVPVAPWRFYLVCGLILAAFTVLLGRVLSLQVLDTDRGREFLQGQGDARTVRTAEIPAYRGLITDRNGEPLAVSTPVVSLWANPQVLAQEKAGQIARLAQALNTTSAALGEKLHNYRNKQFMYLARHLVPSTAREVLALGVKGVRGEREYRRFYPAGEVAAQLVGMTNLDDQGISGMELAYDEWLRGVPGRKKIIKGLRGDVVREIGEVSSAQPGRDLQLSIDLRLQHHLHRELQRAVRISGAESGSVVTLDVHTGEVLAMANHPVYNPNARQEIRPGTTRNRAMTDVVEPGSTMKPLTLVAALESGRYTTQSMIDTSPGWIRVGGKTIPDPRNYGEITLGRVVEKSSQVGISKVALDLGHEPIWDVFARMGLGQVTGSGFPGESAGLLPNRPRWHLTEQVTLAYGYGLTATPLQIARAYSAFANGGLLRPVSMLAVGDELPHADRVMQPETAREIMSVLQAVTESDGTGTRARVPGHRVGGKTGTVHKVGSQGYEDNKYVALFAGVAPADDPRVVTVVVIHEPKGDAYGGGAAAAPVSARVNDGVLRLLDVAPRSGERFDVATLASGGAMQ